LGGAARHAKMLNTDRAWDVFEMLEETFFRVVKPAPEKPALPETTTPSTPADRKPLRSLVNAWAKIANVHHSALWPQVRAHFQLERIDDLPVEWIPQALAFAQGKIDEFQKLQQQQKALPEAPRRMESNVVLANTPKWYQMQLEQLRNDLNNAGECRRRLLAIRNLTADVTNQLYKDALNKMTKGNRDERGNTIVCLDHPISNLHSFEHEAGKMIEDGYYMIFDAIGLGLQYAKMLEL
jgi:hypothetical protein